MCVCVCEHAHLVARVLFVPRGPAPPQFDGRGPQQVLDAAADRAASLRRHRAGSCGLSCGSQRLEPFFAVLLSAAAAVMLSGSPAEPGRGIVLVRMWIWVWIPGHGLWFRCCSASYICAAAKTQSGLDKTQTGLTNRERQNRMRTRHKPFRSDFSE